MRTGASHKCHSHHYVDDMRAKAVVRRRRVLNPRRLKNLPAPSVTSEPRSRYFESDHRIGNLLNNALTVVIYFFKKKKNKQCSLHSIRHATTLLFKRCHLSSTPAAPPPKSTRAIGNRRLSTSISALIPYLILYPCAAARRALDARTDYKQSAARPALTQCCAPRTRACAALFKL